MLEGSVMGKEQVYSCAEDIAMRLKEDRKYGKASLMVGAGFSKNAKSRGMKDIIPPDWSQLADKMYCELYPRFSDMTEDQKDEWKKQRIIKTSGKNVTKLAEEYIVNFDRNKMNHLIENAIADDLFFPGDLHKKLLMLNWADIFTTNYDTLLERTANMVIREKNYQIVCSHNDIAGSISPRIVKLHGSIPHVKPYIICDEDYRVYPIKYAAMVNTVQQAMLETRLCLIGFSGDDPNFQRWMGWIRDNMGECCPIIYLIGIYDKLNEPERRLLENRQIIVVDISCLVGKEEADRHGTAISRFLDLLVEYQKDEDIFQDRPYSKADEFWKPKDMKKYIRDMGGYLKRVAKEMQPYILFPSEIKEKDENGRTQIKVREYPKTEASAAGVELSKSAMIVLLWIKKWNFRNNIQSEYLFYDKNYGRIKSRAFDKQIRKICKAVNIPVRSMHKLRKTYASNLFASNVDENIVQSQMRHRDKTTTHRYYDFSTRTRDYKREQLNKADFLQNVL